MIVTEFLDYDKLTYWPTVVSRLAPLDLATPTVIPRPVLPAAAATVTPVIVQPVPVRRIN